MLPPNLYARVHLLLKRNSTRDRGCGTHPVFPAPSHCRGQPTMQTSGGMRREIVAPHSRVVTREGG